KALRYAYQQDLLVIRSVGFDDKGDFVKVNEDRPFWVEPICRDVDDTEFEAIGEPTLNSRNVCAYFLVRKSTGIAVLSAVHRKSYPTDHKWVSFVESADAVTGVTVDNEFL